MNVLAVSVKLELDSKKRMSSRMFFLSREEESEWTQEFILTKEVPFCKTYDVYLIVSKLLIPSLSFVTLIIFAAQHP